MTKNTSYHYSIIIPHKNTPRLLERCLYSIPTWDEIQIIIISGFSGKGYAQKALKTGVDYAFNTLNMHKVYLWVDIDNAPAVHIYKKLGFKIEGTIKEQFFAGGRYHDSYFMGILKSEYTQREKAIK